MKKIILSLAAATLVVPGASAIAADGFSLSNATSGYKTDVSNQARNREYRANAGNQYNQPV